jgi:hypothetical protein
MRALMVVLGLSLLCMGRGLADGPGPAAPAFIQCA